MSNLWLTVEVSPGSEIQETCDEAVALAEKLGISIGFNFNGVKCLARTGDHPRRLATAWNRVMNTKDGNIQIAADNGDATPNKI